MATIVALTSNVWSSTTNNDPWPGGTKPGSGDTVQTGANVIEIDENITVALLEATTDGTHGYFAVSAWASGTLTITADVLNSWTNVGDYDHGALTVSNAGGSVVLVGNVTAGSNQAAYGLLNNGNMGTITGDITGGGFESFGFLNNGTCGAITGNVTGGSAQYGYGIGNGGTCGVITGNVTGGSVAETPGLAGFVLTDVDGDLICAADGQVPVYGYVRMVENAANTITVLNTDDDAVEYSSSAGPGISNVTVVIGGKIVRR